jgi:hypothetical protein
MKMLPLISEVDVQINIVKWLVTQGWKIIRISPATRQGFNSKERLVEEFKKANIDISKIKFSTKGEDILAIKDGKSWKIECKGLSSGENQTIEENFRRAIASVALYYTQKDKSRLGLAMPEYYMDYFRKKLPQALRKAINLWLFIYTNKDEAWEPWAPEDELPET